MAVSKDKGHMISFSSTSCQTLFSVIGSWWHLPVWTLLHIGDCSAAQLAPSMTWAVLVPDSSRCCQLTNSCQQIQDKDWAGAGGQFYPRERGEFDHLPWLPQFPVYFLCLPDKWEAWVIEMSAKWWLICQDKFIMALCHGEWQRGFKQMPKDPQAQDWHTELCQAGVQRCHLWVIFQNSCVHLLIHSFI